MAIAVLGALAVLTAGVVFVLLPVGLRLADRVSRLDRDGAHFGGDDDDEPKP